VKLGLISVDDWQEKLIAIVIKGVGKELRLDGKIVMQVLRYALAGLESGVGVPRIIKILGKEKAVDRLERCRLYQCVE